MKDGLFDPVEYAATISDCGRYRYRLSRVWNKKRSVACFIALNPSTADHTKDDPTIRRMVGFARSWGCGGITVVNLFGLRATNPNELHDADDPVGPDNDRVIAAEAGAAQKVIAAWGVMGTYRDRESVVLTTLGTIGAVVECLGVTKYGRPKHPLYVPADAQLVPFPP